MSGNGESTPSDGELEILNICMLAAARRNERREGRKRAVRRKEGGRRKGRRRGEKGN